MTDVKKARVTCFTMQTVALAAVYPVPHSEMHTPQTAGHSNSVIWTVTDNVAECLPATGWCLFATDRQFAMHNATGDGVLWLDCSW